MATQPLTPRRRLPLASYPASDTNHQTLRRQHYSAEKTTHISATRQNATRHVSQTAEPEARQANVPMASTAQQDADIRRPDLDLALTQHPTTRRIGATPARPAPLGRDDARRRRLPARRAAARRTRAHPAAARPRVRRAQLRRAMLRAAAARDARRRALPRRGALRARRTARAGALPRRVPGGDGRAGAARRRRPLRDARRRRAAGRGLGHHAAGLVRARRAHRRRGGVAVLAGAGRVRAGDARVHGRVRGVGEDALRSRHQTALSEAAAAAETGGLRDGNTVCVGGRAVESVSQHVCPALH